MPQQPRSLSLAAVILSLAAGGCGSSGSSAKASPTAASSKAKTSHAGRETLSPGTTTRVVIAGFAYTPPTITVSPGTQITWVNRDTTAHTATVRNRGPDTGTIKPGASGSVTITKPGTYQYFCAFHPFMHGTIIVP